MNTSTSGNVNYTIVFSDSPNTFTSMPTNNKVIYIQNNEY